MGGRPQSARAALPGGASANGRAATTRHRPMSAGPTPRRWGNDSALTIRALGSGIAPTQQVGFTGPACGGPSEHGRFKPSRVMSLHGSGAPCGGGGGAYAAAAPACITANLMPEDALPASTSGGVLWVGGQRSRPAQPGSMPPRSANAAGGGDDNGDLQISVARASVPRPRHLGLRRRLHRKSHARGVRLDSVSHRYQRTARALRCTGCRS